uniref:Uncharacterized protein n=1 Tax=Oryza punctata TaxID=4537 RepID=A0A0E0MKR7_ORYPU
MATAAPRPATSCGGRPLVVLLLLLALVVIAAMTEDQHQLHEEAPNNTAFARAPLVQEEARVHSQCTNHPRQCPPPHKY